MNLPSRADERTSLNAADSGGQDGTSSSTTVRIKATIAAAATTAALAVVLCVGLFLASNGSRSDALPDARGGGRSSGTAKGLVASSGGSAGEEEGRVIPSMQPFSTTDPADAHCPHMDRPRGTWPTSAWGALANASTELHTSLPTNAWWENVVLGSPTQVCVRSSLSCLLACCECSTVVCVELY